MTEPAEDLAHDRRFSMPLAEAMSTQRAIRRLKTDPVDDELVLRLIELALKAPTGSNQQNWEFVVVRDPAVKRNLGRLNRGPGASTAASDGGSCATTRRCSASSTPCSGRRITSRRSR